LFIVSETTLYNDTVEAGAHVLLPAAAWGEKDQRTPPMNLHRQ
jgi:assimilatory nitrate reductase catalytic subunit